MQPSYDEYGLYLYFLFCTKMETPLEASSKLNSTWEFWYASRKEKDHHIPYEARLTEISSFSGETGSKKRSNFKKSSFAS